MPSKQRQADPGETLEQASRPRGKDYCTVTLVMPHFTAASGNVRGRGQSDRQESEWDVGSGQNK